MTAEQKKNYNKSQTQDKHCKNEETIGKEPGQPSFLVYKSIPEEKKNIGLFASLDVRLDIIGGT